MKTWRGSLKRKSTITTEVRKTTIYCRENFGQWLFVSFLSVILSKSLKDPSLPYSNIDFFPYFTLHGVETITRVNQRVNYSNKRTRSLVQTISIFGKWRHVTLTRSSTGRRLTIEVIVGVEPSRQPLFRGPSARLSGQSTF